jgi:hypothetical protein
MTRFRADRPALFERLETRDMLTTLALQVLDPFIGEDFGEWATAGLVTRDGDISEPLIVYLTSSDETEATVPATVEIPAFESTVMFPIAAVDDTLLDGFQLVTLAAAAEGAEPVTAELPVFDVETISVDFNQLTASPGDTLTATISVSTTDRIEPFTFLFDSARPDEIASFEVTFDPTENSKVFELPVTADAYAEGVHTVSIQVGLGVDGYMTDQAILTLSDEGVTTLNPVADGRARDADQDGIVFEDVATHFHEIAAQPAAANGSFGESRGILEFDMSSIPAGAIVQSAVLTLDVTGAAYQPGNDLLLDVFAYAGNGIVESTDANQIADIAGQLTVPTDEGWPLGSYAIPLDVAKIQSLVDSGSQLGFVAKMQLSTMVFASKEYFRPSSRPALHLVLSQPPILTANSLTVNEGETIILTAANLAATDADSADDELTFTVSNVTGGQFLAAGSAATSFTQEQVAAGQITFAHDGNEVAPAFDVTVSDGGYIVGPDAASISFLNVNDNAPVIVGGQTFSVSEHALSGSAVGTVAFSDADLPGDSFAVSLVAGNTGGVFGIDNSGNLTIVDNTSLDYESATAYTLTVRVFDGVHSTDQDMTINVLDVAETKFYVADDGSANRTYEYTAAGTAIENYGLNSINAAPRGAASTAAGDRVWVVDANRKVYVYDTSGGLLGSWTAGSMSSSATPEGIATDGIDVWIVDAKSDKVFKYAGAASRLSGSQNAASSFNLNGSNSSAKDIVTDGTSLWIVNSASTDKVFKYTVAGTLLGSWTIGSANSNPTGITIDPANVSDIWIVDNGTDAVYRYAGAATRTSGSQSPASSFALAAGNTNPQGIADPPPNFVGDSAKSAPPLTPTRVSVDISTETRNSAAVVKLKAREHVFDTYAAYRFEAQSLLIQSRRQVSIAVDQHDDPIRSSDDEQRREDGRHAVFAAFESTFSSMWLA